MIMCALVTIGVALAAAPAVARSIPGRMWRQGQRIDRGVARGQLTPREAGQLGREQNRIAQERSDARADGRVTRGERREIRHDQRRASRNIYWQRHDGQHRRWHRSRRPLLRHRWVQRRRHWRHR